MGAKADSADRRRPGRRPALTPGELAQFPQALCQSRQPSPKHWWPKHWSPARGCQYYEVGGWPRCRSSVDECRQVYATTLLRSVKRKVAAASKIILSHRQGGRAAAASTALAQCWHRASRGSPFLTIVQWGLGAGARSRRQSRGRRDAPGGVSSDSAASRRHRPVDWPTSAPRSACRHHGLAYLSSLSNASQPSRRMFASRMTGPHLAISA